MNIADNHFALFGLPERFALDAKRLDMAFRDVQGQVHPDRFVDAGATEQRVALQWATRANEAYRTLRDPLRRAAYLCTLRGADLETESNTAMPAEFLMRQLEWREALDDARDADDAAALQKLEAELDDERSALMRRLEIALDETPDIGNAVEAVRQWMFVERFEENLASLAEKLDAC